MPNMEKVISKFHAKITKGAKGKERSGCQRPTWITLMARQNYPKKQITIHMPQRTSKILLVRLTANENALF